MLFGSTNGWIFPYICNSNKVWSKKVQSVNGSITILFWSRFLDFCHSTQTINDRITQAGEEIK